MGSNISYEAQGTVILSVGHAHELARLAFFTDDYHTALDIGRIVLESDKILGDADDYHNLSVEFSRKDDYLTAFLIVEKGLLQYPYNIDLLADIIYYGSKAKKYDECEKHVTTLLRRPSFLWNWRAYSFLVDYFIEKTDYWEPDILCNASDQTSSEEGDPYFLLYNRALVIAEDFKQVLPEEEKAYLSLYKVHSILRTYYFGMNKNEKADEEKEEAENALEEAINKPDFAAVQCCLKYADLLFEQQKCAEVINICKKAMQYAESQPSAKLGYFLYLSGQSKDILIQKDGAFTDDERVQDALSDYVAAYRTDISPTYKGNIKNRVILLCAKNGCIIPNIIGREIGEGGSQSDSGQLTFLKT